MLYNKYWDTPLNEVGEVLLKGADLLEKHGHAKHTRLEHDGSMCFLGAVEAAQKGIRAHLNFTGDTLLTKKAAAALVYHLGLPETTYPTAVAADWNNRPERTAQEVIDAMRMAARTTAKAMA